MVETSLFLRDVQVRDYSGTYAVRMVPCIASPNGEFSIPPVCSPREPLTFDMDVRFQQVSTADIRLIWDVKMCPGFVPASHLNKIHLLPVNPALYIMSSPGERPGCGRV